jgi:2-polyprenyl-3-methyl-5-hydroxy-6-metoxy-1,4-benzoquinol methylase
MQSKQHWEKVYSTKGSDTVSWFQEHAAHSLSLIKQTSVSQTASIIDVGGGASTLVDDLLSEGYSSLTILDLSKEALIVAQNRLAKSPLSKKATAVNWLEANITNVSLPKFGFDVWHDRAVFHFLTSAEDRQAYINKVMHTVKPGGHVIVATFGENGPEECSGLPVVRYNPDDLHAEFGTPFKLLKHEKEMHQTPFGTEQQFIYCYCRKSE